ncbi:MAG TPA: lytic transglycosylase domain-containing protein [Burkholderiales bacterium]|nr:lytic transglycosylase domain-containing protein [Burkholderiales bacterium]
MLRIAFLCLVLVAPAALAARLEISLRVPIETIREALSARLATSPSRPSEIYREGRCRYLNLEAPKLEGAEGQLRLTGPGTGALGLELGGKCQNAAAWRGSLQFTLLPRIDEAGSLRMRIVDSGIKETTGARAPAMLWDMGKRQVHARLERFSYDLGASREALIGLLRSAAPPDQAAAMEQALQQLQVLEPRVEESQIVVPVALELPDAWLAAPAAASSSAAPLTEAEMEALDTALQPWDAFLVYILRQVAVDGQDSALRQRLFTLLLDSRYQLAAIASGDEQAAGDPLRALFMDTWKDLRTILADAQRDGTLPASLLRYALFIDAGDALHALENAAPSLSLSADGLRQLARSLRPGEAADPLAYQWDVDTELRGLFDVTEMPEPESAPPPAPTRSWLDFLIPHAYAAQALDRWVPTKDELPDYQARISELLQKTTATDLERVLVPTTALIESCWRQYVVRNGKVTYLRSQSSSIGIMQINQKVWRGFYDVERLRWDTAYNIRAGAQILARYVKDYAIPYAQKSGNPNHIPRAAYAVYNAGPRAVGRFNKSPPHPREQRVDEKLWTLYQGIAGGAPVDLGSCGIKRPAG